MGSTHRRRRSRGRYGEHSRVLGIDDAPSGPGWRRDALLVGAVYRGGASFEGLLTTRVRRDGSNATRRIIEMVDGSKFRSQLHVMMLDGIGFGGLNVVSLDAIHDALGLPLVAVMRRPPDRDAMATAMERVSGTSRKQALMLAAGEIHEVPVDYRPGAGGTSRQWTTGALHCHLRGLTVADASALLTATCTRSKVPEPLRAAHLIGSGLVLGESGRRA